MRDPDTLPRFHMTGNGVAMVSNRLSHFFDFRGPSLTVDTGCSTSLVALHLACQSLRSGDSEVSVVGAANVMLNPDMFNQMSSLGYVPIDQTASRSNLMGMQVSFQRWKIIFLR